MTYFAEHPTQHHIKPPKSGFTASIVKLLLAGVYFMLGIYRETDTYLDEGCDDGKVTLSRPMRRKYKHTLRKKATPSRNLSVFGIMVPNETGKLLSQTQFLERCTKLSVMGRFQIYDFLYYRREFKRKGAIRNLGRAPRRILEPAATHAPCGLSASHLWPD